MKTNEILNNLKETGYITIADPNENIKKLAELDEGDPDIKELEKRVDELEKDKVDKIEGKELSSNDFTDELKEKLETLDETAEGVHIKSDWNAPAGDSAEILNRPSVDDVPTLNSNNLVKSGGVATQISQLGQKVVLLEYWGFLSTDIERLSPGTFFYNSFNNTIAKKTGEIGTTTFVEYPIIKNQLYIYDGKFYTSFNGVNIERVYNRIYNYDIELDKCIELKYWGQESESISALPVGAYFFNSYSNTISYKKGNDPVILKDFPITENTLFIYNKHFFASIDGSQTLTDITDEQLKPYQSKVDKIKFGEIVEFGLPPVTILTNAIITNDKTIATAGSDNYRVYVFDIKKFKTLNIGAIANYNNPFYGFSSGDDYAATIFEISELQPENVAVNKVFESVAVPNNAKYVLINIQTGEAGTVGVTAICSPLLNMGDNPLLGKKWACVGDSLTEVNTRTTLHYFDYIAQEMGVIPINYGVSGTGYARRREENIAFYQRISSIDVDCDIVTIFGSFNDLGAINSDFPLGYVDDTGIVSIAGCINQTLDNLFAIKPIVRLGIIAPTPWDTTQPGNGQNADHYVDLLKAICDRRSIPFLDLYYHSNLRPWDATFRQMAYSKDGGSGTHPDETGHSLIAPMFRQFILSLI